MTRRGMARGPVAGVREWVGGRLSAPLYVTEGEPYRPDIIVWLELPEGVIVGTHLVHPSEPESAVAEVLTAAMQRPMIGPPRRPALVRVADALLVESVAATLGDRSRVRVAPTPELDEVVRHFGEAAAADRRADAEPASYLEHERIAPAVMATLFRHAELLFMAAPWRHASDTDVLRVDIPRLGVEGACLSIIGALGENFGILLFPSLAGYDAFLAAAVRSPRGDAVDLGTTCLALTFERGADIPVAMRREASEHGWPVAGPNAYPVVTHRDRDGMLRPLREQDVRAVAACAVALTAFTAKHGAHLGAPGFGPLCESYTGDDDVTVRFTVPYAAHDAFDLDAPPLDFDAPRPARAARPPAGRNDPCPCGSGRKYKKCHLGSPLPGASDAAPAAAGEDGYPRVIGAILDWAAQRFGTAWASPIRRAFDESFVASLVVPWCAFHATADGRRLAEHFLAAGADRLPADAQAWITAQLAAWLSIWEVTAVEPGRGVELTDLLSGEVRHVRDRRASLTAARRDTILARVVEHGGVSTLWGVAPRVLPPRAAADLVRRARGRLRLRRAVPVERLRDEKFGHYLLARWEEAVEDLDDQASVPPVLQNTDGEPLLATTDHFTVAAGARAAVEAGLAACGAEVESGGPTAVYRVSRPGGGPLGMRTLTATARLTAGALTVETNSLARADDLRQRLETACAGAIRHRIRAHADPRARLADGGGVDPGPPADLDPAEVARIERELKQHYYERWLDDPIPALGGQTPRAAARTAAGRGRVDLLLREMEHAEGRSAAGARMDFAPLRRALGLEP